jgi:hypothetical protein
MSKPTSTLHANGSIGCSRIAPSQRLKCDITTRLDVDSTVRTIVRRIISRPVRKSERLRSVHDNFRTATTLEHGLRHESPGWIGSTFRYRSGNRKRTFLNVEIRATPFQGSLYVITREAHATVRLIQEAVLSLEIHGRIAVEQNFPINTVGNDKTCSASCIVAIHSALNAKRTKARNIEKSTANTISMQIEK